MSSPQRRTSQLRSTASNDDDGAMAPSLSSRLLPPPPVMHSTAAKIPGLHSAPPSGNTVPLPPPPTFATKEMAQSLPPPPTMTNLPPPPTMTSLSDNATKIPDNPLTEDTVPSERPPEPLECPDPLPITQFAPKSHSFLARRQTHLPVLVIATESAHHLAWKNRVRLMDLLNGLAQDLSSVESAHPIAPFRSVSKTCILGWNDIKLNFVSPDEITSHDSNKCQKILQHHAALQDSDGNLMEELDLLEDQVDHLLQTDPHAEAKDKSLMEQTRARVSRLEQVTKDAYALTSPPNIPWLWRFRTALDYSTDYLDGDLISQPALCILVCSSSDPNPDDCFADLSNPYNLPHPYQVRDWDNNALQKVVLLLHDACEGPKDFDGDTQESILKQQYGGYATVLSVNSIVPSMAKALEEEETYDIWGGKGKIGNCLSASDRTAIRRYIANTVTSVLLPGLERRISELNNVVTERKKGLRNVMRGFFRAPTKPETPATGAEKGRYRFDTIESQTRLLADTLFLIKDYDSALSMYKLIRDDYKNDRALLHYASIQEMMALSTYLLDPSRSKEIFTYLETALFSYTRAAEEERSSSGGPTARPTTAPKSTRLATRLCLVLSSAKNIMTPERHLEVADLLASASSHETALGAAVLLEQSSSHYYKAGMFRKYAFHMLMSGHMFRSAQQEHHAFRCFTSALYIYHDGQWDELHNHLRSALAAQLYSLGRMAASVDLYAKLVGTTGGGRVSVKSQQKFVNHLLEIVRDHTKKALVGADRMAHPSGNLRQERFHRIEQVIRETVGAVRVLELPNMDLPAIDDSTVQCVVESDAAVDKMKIPGLGNCKAGVETVWQELACQTLAELRATGPDYAHPNEEDMPSPLLNITDTSIQAVISEMVKDKTNRSLVARAKKSGGIKPQPAVRARMEPLSVSFQVENPLSVKVEMRDLQLIARMKSEAVCTNEDAIAIGPTPQKTWAFTSSDSTFLVPDFCRISQEVGWQSADKLDPYFVVTKTSLTLEARGSSTVKLGICPLVKGDLEIIGIRCKLFDSVWMYHPFKLQGPLLQNSQENRANRARAQSMLLKARVDVDMPRLTATLIPASQAASCVQGQVSKWMLRLCNIGTAPASNISLKTNLPWMNIESAPRESEASQTSLCAGATGTLYTLPITGGGVNTPGTIQPGEEVNIPLSLRTFGKAQQDFYMLYRYELAGSNKERWLRQMLDIAIYPSLNLAASLIPSSWAKREHILSVELTNCKDEQMLLEKVSLASREYRLEPIGGQMSEESNNWIQLDYRERVTMHYRLVLTDTPSLKDCVMTECKFTEGNGGGSRKECLASPEIDFLCLEAAQTRFQTALNRFNSEMARVEGTGEEDQPRHVSQIRRAKNQLDEDAEEKNSNNHPTSIARLFPKSTSKTKIDLICSWKSLHTSGQHHITGVVVRPRVKSKGCPIDITCQHPGSVVHNFVNGPVYVPLEVTVRNRLVETSVSFDFSVTRPTSFEFMGAERFNVELGGGDELTIPLKAVVPVAGTYNLQKLRLEIMKEGEEPVPYMFTVQWMVQVNNEQH